GGEECHPEQPAEQAMRPFPPVDHLERLEAHAPIEVAVLGNLLVLSEGCLPLFVREGRNDADDWLPFGDGQPRPGEPRRPAHQERYKDQGRQRPKPGAHRPERRRRSDGTAICSFLVERQGRTSAYWHVFLGRARHAQPAALGIMLKNAKGAPLSSTFT